MGSNEDPLPLFDLRGDYIVPVWQRPGDGVFEALAGRKLLLRQVSVAAVLRTKMAPAIEQLDQNKQKKGVPLSLILQK